MTVLGFAPLQDIVRRHWDQACRDSRADPGVLQVSELFDTVGLGGELEARGLRPPTRVGQNPSLDFVARYRADGSISAMGAFDFSLDTAQAIELEAVLRSRALRVPRLLEKKNLSSNTPRGVCTYLLVVTRLTVDSCMLISLATCWSVSGRRKAVPFSKNSLCFRTMHSITLTIVLRRCSIVWMSQRADLRRDWINSRVSLLPSLLSLSSSL